MARIVQVEEKDLWGKSNFVLMANGKDTDFMFGTDCVATVRKPTRGSKGCPMVSSLARYTDRFYETGGLPIPSSAEEMTLILGWQQHQMTHNTKEFFGRRDTPSIEDIKRDMKGKK